MGFFRNPEIRREMVLWGAGLAVCLFAAHLFSGSRGMVVCLFAGFLFTAAHFLSSFFRYRKIAFLSEEVERCLHGKQRMEIAEQAEGELAILQTELQKMIQKLAHQAKLLQDDKIYLMNSIADISHQIRTPLTTINLIVSRLASRGLEEKTRYELLRNLEGLLQHMEWLVETLLKMAKLDAGTIQMKRTRINVGELIERATRDLLIPMELREQKLIVSCEKETGFLGDMAWTQESLANIVKNCMESAPIGGEIRIEAEENVLYTKIVIEDNGCGISKEDLPHLFERFYKGKHTSEKGVGIGLALAKMIVKEQGGILEASNCRKGGAHFEMRFYKSVV